MMPELLYKGLTFIVLVGLALTPCSLFGQEGGLPSGSGHVPTIDWLHRAVVEQNLAVLEQLHPGAPAAIIVSPTVKPIDLGFVGLGPGVIIPDPHAPGGSVQFGLVADPLGRIIIPFSAPPELGGHVLWTQVVSLDPLAPFGTSLSHGSPVVFGAHRDTEAISSDDVGGTRTLSRIFCNGALAEPIRPDCLQLTTVPIALTQSPEMAPARTDVPVVDDLSQTSTVIRLPDDVILSVYRTPTFEDILFAIRPGGDMDELFRAQGTALDSGLVPEMAVSTLDPFAAVVTENPQPAFGGATTFLVRTDGLSDEGSHLFVRPLFLPPGLEVDETSLTFLRGALFFGDGESALFRHDLLTGVTTPVVFPPSGGQTPIYVDESCAVAGDGSALAIGAGVDEDNHDVYVVDRHGTAVNLTNLPGDYEDAAPGDFDGAQMAMSADGSRVAYMRTVVENEAFVKDVAPGSPEIIMTPLTWFIDSIDTVTGFGFATSSAAVFFAAGKDFDASDIYRHDASGVANVSATSGDVVAPYDLGATLEPLRRFRHGGVFFTLAGTSNASTLLAHDENGAKLSIPLGTVDRLIGLDSALLVISRSGGQTTARAIDTDGPPTVVATHQVGTATTLASCRRVSNGSAAVLLTGGTIILAAPSGTLTPLSTPQAVVSGGSITFDSSGDLVVALESAVGIETWHHDTTGGSWSLIGSLPSPVEFLR